MQAGESDGYRRRQHPVRRPHADYYCLSACCICVSLGPRCRLCETRLTSIERIPTYPQHISIVSRYAVYALPGENMPTPVGGGPAGRWARHCEVSLIVRPIELRDANLFIAEKHRHHKPVRGHRFSLAAWDGDTLIGVATVGRPVARNGGAPLEVLEVTRLCTDGTRNACSFLYSAAARVGRAMGYKRIQTYILADEPGTSLQAAGWVDEGEAGGGQWKHTDGKPRRTDQPTERKRRWAKTLS